MEAALSFIASYGPLLAFYGGAAALALWASWGDRELRVVGVLLAACFLVSNVLWFLGTVQQRPGVYTFLQVLLAASAYIAWCYSRHELGSGPLRRLGLIGLVVLSVSYIITNVAFAWTYAGQWELVHLHEVTTNLIFLAECVTTATLGIIDGVRSGRIRRGPRRRDVDVESHAVVRGEDN